MSNDINELRTIIKDDLLELLKQNRMVIKRRRDKTFRFMMGSSECLNFNFNVLVDNLVNDGRVNVNQLDRSKELSKFNKKQITGMALQVVTEIHDNF